MRNTFKILLLSTVLYDDHNTLAWIQPPFFTTQKIFAESKALKCVKSASSHSVNGIICREVTIDINAVGPITILEATADSQDHLVDMALLLEEEEFDGTNQLQVGDPYGTVLWPAAYSISNYLLDNCSSTFSMDREEKIENLLPLAGISILELGTGTGLISLAASIGGASRVIATDYEQLPLEILDYAQKKLNEGLTPIELVNLNICDSKTLLPPADIVVAADIMYEPSTGRAMAQRAFEALQRGSRVLVGDSPGRPGRAAFLEELERLGIQNAVFYDTVGQTCSGPRHDLICGKESSSVSTTPKALSVAIMDLLPEYNLCQSTI